MNFLQCLSAIMGKPEQLSNNGWPFHCVGVSWLLSKAYDKNDSRNVQCSFVNSWKITSWIRFSNLEKPQLQTTFHSWKHSVWQVKLHQYAHVGRGIEIVRMIETCAKINLFLFLFWLFCFLLLMENGINFTFNLLFCFNVLGSMATGGMSGLVSFATVSSNSTLSVSKLSSDITKYTFFKQKANSKQTLNCHCIFLHLGIPWWGAVQFVLAEPLDMYSGMMYFFCYSYFDTTWAVFYVMSLGCGPSTL